MSKKKWLDASEHQAWIGLIASMMLLDNALDRQLQQDSGLSHGQYGIMARLSVSPGHSMHMSALALQTSNSQSRLSHAVARLEDAGWVARARCPSNKRAVHATLTETGYALVVAAAPGHVATVRRLLFDRLTPEQVSHLTEITQIVLGSLAEEGYEVPPILHERVATR